MNFKLNYSPSPDVSAYKDFDDHAHLFALTTTAAAPAEKYLIETEVFHQQVGDCVINSAIGALEILLLNTDPDKYQVDTEHSRMSRLALYYTCRSNDGTVKVDNGTYLATAAKVLLEIGVCAEKYWTYENVPTKMFVEPELEAFIRCSENRIGGTLRITNNDAAISKIVSAIDANHPIQIGTAVSEKFCNNIGTSDVVYAPTATDIIAGGHAMLITGYKLTANGYWFWVRNSWGTDFGITNPNITKGYGGKGGHFWMHQSYVSDPRTSEIIIYSTSQFLK